jgi:hypothetical protein
LQRQLGCQLQQRSMATRVEQQAAANPGKGIAGPCAVTGIAPEPTLCLTHAAAWLAQHKLDSAAEIALRKSITSNSEAAVLTMSYSSSPALPLCDRPQVLAPHQPRHTRARDHQAHRHLEGQAHALPEQRCPAHWRQELLWAHYCAA